MKYISRYCCANVEINGTSKAKACWHACQVVLFKTTSIDIKVDLYWIHFLCDFLLNFCKTLVRSSMVFSIFPSSTDFGLILFLCAN